MSPTRWKVPGRQCSRSAESKRAGAAVRSPVKWAGFRLEDGPPPTMRDPKRVAILISGRGSNMRALVEHEHDYRVALVASNKPEAPGLQWARERSLETWALESKGVSKEEFDRRMSAALDEYNVGTIALA